VLYLGLFGQLVGVCLLLIAVLYLANTKKSASNAELRRLMASLNAYSSGHLSAASNRNSKSSAFMFCLERS
jgi:hypothetical protein